MPSVVARLRDQHNLVRCDSLDALGRTSSVASADSHQARPVPDVRLRQNRTSALRRSPLPRMRNGRSRANAESRNVESRNAESRNEMKRAIVLITVFLLAGAIVNVAVAWGCALLMQFRQPCTGYAGSNLL